MEDAKAKITDAELEIMQVLWTENTALTLGQLKSALSDRNGETIKTLLRRLCQKGAVSQEKREVYYYTALVKREELIEYKRRRLIDTFYGGSAAAMVTAMVEHDHIKPQDVEELRTLFNTLWEKEDT